MVNKVVSMQEAVADIFSGAVIMIGGFGGPGAAFNLIAAASHDKPVLYPEAVAPEGTTASSFFCGAKRPGMRRVAAGQDGPSRQENPRFRVRHPAPRRKVPHRNGLQWAGTKVKPYPNKGA